MGKKKSFDDEDTYDLTPKKKNKKSLLNQLDEITSDGYVPSGISDSSTFLPSSMFSSRSYQVTKEEDPEDLAPDWFDDWLSSSRIEFNKKSKGRNDLFESAGIIGGKKKKKKKKEEKNYIDYKKEFEPESALFRNLLMDQNKFVESLQREYDNIMSKKGTARNVNKAITDLMMSINSGRQLSMQLVDKQASLKKQIAELSLKQQKELGGELDENNMTDFASTYIHNLLTKRAEVMGTGAAANVSEYTEDDLFDELDSQLLGDEDTEEYEEAQKYLKYENRHVKVCVVLEEGGENLEENYDFVAKDEDGEVIDDYPLPLHTKISINRSTGLATDSLGNKYPIIWDDAVA